MSIADQLIEEGLQKGLVLGQQQGLLGGEIRFAQRLLGIRAISDEELASTSMEELQKLARELEARVMKRYKCSPLHAAERQIAARPHSS